MSRLRLRHWIFIIMTGLLLIAATAFYGWILHGLPAITQIEAGLALPSTRIYDRHGQLLYEILPPEQGRNRVIALEDVPPHCVNAVIAVEDANYWSHAGVDPEGIARALWINLRGGEVIAGGSTITQQTARLLLLDPQQRAQRTIQRKLKEMVLAIRLQNQTSKDHVLSLYLNQVYFGNLAYGIEGAAQAYFHKAAGDLSLAECALLAGIIQNPALHDPLSNPESARQRQEIALNLMVERGMVATAEADSARHDELQFGAVRFPIQAPHFVMAVWRQLERNYPDALYGRGLDVVTTLDLSWQQTAETVVNAQLDALNDPQNGVPAEAHNAAVVALDPFTGQVLTMLGSPDYFDEAIDGAVNAALAPRQPGSTLKPFTYAAAMNPALANPYTPATVLYDVETPFVTARLESYTPSNFAFVEHGPVPIREALGSSYNIPAVIALQKVGVEPFVRFVADAGLETLAANPNVDLAITLGGGEVRLLDLAAAYSIFPNSGFRIEPSMILRVTARDGEQLYEWRAPRLDQRVLDERVAWLVTDMLSDNHARIPSFGPHSALQIGRPAAAKTGTTTDFRDNWVMGYTPNLVVGVWVGNADNTPMVDVTGVSGAGPVYNQFMRRILLGQPELDFGTPPDGIVRAEICTLSGLLPTEYCPLRSVDWFIDGTQPTAPDTLYRPFAIDRRSGDLADESTPPQYIVNEVFVVLPPHARDWAARQGLPLPPRGALADDDQTLRLLAPDPYTAFEISSQIPASAQRLRFHAALPAGTASVLYTLNGDVLARTEEAPYAVWWPLQVGDWELGAQAILQDGQVVNAEAIPFSVFEEETPQPRTVPPVP